MRHFLVRLSEHMMKPGVAYTAPSLLAGFWNLLAMIDALDDYPVKELRHLASLALARLGDHEKAGEAG